MYRWNEPDYVQAISDTDKSKEFNLLADGCRIHAKLDLPACGNETYPLLLVIHGFTGHMEERHIIAVMQTAIETGFATLRVEMYGHGMSDGLFENHTLYKWLTQAMAVTDYARGLDFVTDLYLTGHSQGGLTSILLAGLKPEVFKAVIPLSPANLILEGARKGELLGFSFDPENPPEVLASPDWYDGRRLNGNYIRVAQTLHIEEAIRRYSGPVLLIHGDADTEVPMSCSVDAAREYRNAKLVLIPGDTHCYDHHLDMVTDALRDFLKEQSNG